MRGCDCWACLRSSFSALSLSSSLTYLSPKAAASESKQKLQDVSTILPQPLCRSILRYIEACFSIVARSTSSKDLVLHVLIQTKFFFRSMLHRASASLVKARATGCMKEKIRTGQRCLERNSTRSGCRCRTHFAIRGDSLF